MKNPVNVKEIKHIYRARILSDRITQGMPEFTFHTPFQQDKNDIFAL